MGDMKATWQAVGEGGYSDVFAACAHRGAIYCVQRGTLYKVAPETGAYETASNETWQTKILVSTGDALVSIEDNGAMYEVLADGGYRQLDGNWSRTTAACAHGGKVYACDGGSMWVADVASGGYSELGTDTSWSTRVMVSVGDLIVTIEEGGAMYSLDPRTCAWKQLAGTWAYTRAACALGGLVIADDNGSMYAADPLADSWEEIETGTSWSSSVMMSIGKTVFTIDKDGGIYRMDPT
jgi:hypothetical protein